MVQVRKPRVATVWLGGCSGCHMSFLDLDERLLDLAAAMDLVFSPIADVKVFPEGVDVVLVEGAACNEEHLEMARRVRARSRLVVAFGDCAVTGNVTAIRNAPTMTSPTSSPASRPLRASCPGSSTGCCRSTRWCRWTSSCPAARRTPTSSTPSSSTRSRGGRPRSTGSSGTGSP
jgi:Ni,Fe-hydrogenase III small subunit